MDKKKPTTERKIVRYSCCGVLEGVGRQCWRKLRGYAGLREAESRLQTFERSYSHGVGSPVCNLEYINSTDYKRKFDALSDDRTLNRAVYERCKAMLIH